MEKRRFVVCVLVSMTGIILNVTIPAQAQAPAANAPSEIYQSVYNGWKWWHVYCYRCHGTNAIATSIAPSLIDPAKRMPLPTFVSTARNGRPALGMQSWRKLLDDKQLAQIYMYVQARTDNVLLPGRPDEIGVKGGPWIPPPAWPKRK